MKEILIPILLILAIIFIFLFFTLKHQVTTETKKRHMIDEKNSKKFHAHKPDQVRKLEKIQNLEKANQLLAEQDLQQLRQESKIVGIVKPLGFWTMKIFHEQKDLIMARLQLNSSKNQGGYWVRYVNARKKMSAQKGKFRE